MCTRVWWGNLRERDHWDEDGSSGSRKGLWGLDGFGSEQGQVAGACEYSNELWGSIKCGEFLD